MDSWTGSEIANSILSLLMLPEVAPRTVGIAQRDWKESLAQLYQGPHGWEINIRCIEPKPLPFSGVLLQPTRDSPCHIRVDAYRKAMPMGAKWQAPRLEQNCSTCKKQEVREGRDRDVLGDLDWHLSCSSSSCFSFNISTTIPCFCFPVATQKW